MSTPPDPSLLPAAAYLARRGEYGAALAVLDACGSAADPKLVLRLRAKIFAQQGRLDDAINSWNEVLRMDPNDPEARPGLAAAQQIRGHPGRRFYLRANLYYAILLLGIAALVPLALRSGPSKAAAPDVVQALLAANERQSEFSRGVLDALRALTDRSNERTAEALKTLHADLAALGTRVNAQAETSGSTAAAHRTSLTELQDGVRSLHAGALQAAKADESTAETLKTLRADLAALSAGLKALAETSGASTTRLAGQLAALETKANAASTASEAHGKALAHLETLLTETATSLASLKAATDGRLGRVDERLTSLADLAQKNHAEWLQADHRQEAAEKAAASRQESVAKAIAQADAKQEQLAARAQAIEAKSAALASDVQQGLKDSSARQSAAADALRADVVGYLDLVGEIRRLADVHRRAGSPILGVSRSERAQMRQDLERLAERVDTLLARLRSASAAPPPHAEKEPGKE